MILDKETKHMYETLEQGLTLFFSWFLTGLLTSKERQLSDCRF